VAEDTHVFGGGWTTEKLAILAKYLKAYTTALKKQPFRKLYIDAFAGTGRREDSSIAKAQKRAVVSGQLALADDNQPDLTPFLDGSASMALKTEPAFDEYVFVEKSPRRCKDLEQLRRDFPQKADRITILQDDANLAIEKLCAREWQSRRAVLFLDPYGVQVKWTTIEAIARTQAIDLWVLFPLGGVNRMLTKDGDIPPEWRTKLNDLLGTTDWYDALYRPDGKPAPPSLFDSEAEERSDRLIKQRVQVLADYFLARLQKVFPHVAAVPAILYNSKHSPLFMFCFAAGHPAGGKIALRIANHVLKMGSLKHGQRLKY